MSPENNSETTDEDASLKMLNAKRMLELKRRARAASTKPTEKKEAKQKPLSDREIVVKSLVERGDEVFSSAEVNYPREMAILTPRLADLIRQGKISTISGGELLQFLRSLGLRVSVETSISVEDHGKLVRLSDKLKENMNG